MGVDQRACARTTGVLLLVAAGKRCRDPTFVVVAVEENRKRRLRRQEVVCYNFWVWQPDKTGNYQRLGRRKGCFVARGENGGAGEALENWVFSRPPLKTREEGKKRADRCVTRSL